VVAREDVDELASDIGAVVIVGLLLLVGREVPNT
jgi:hypothetical protein